MKKLLLFCALFIAFGLKSQNTNNVVIFSEDFQPFTAFINGIQQNITPQTNVKITGLIGNAHVVRINFANNLPQIDKKIYFEGYNKEIAYRLVETPKGLKLRYFSEANLGQVNTYPNQTVVVYRTTPPNQSVTITEHSTTTTTSGHPHSHSDNVNINVDGFGVNINVNDSHTTTTTTSTTTTTYGSSHVGNGQVVYVDGYTGSIGCQVPQCDMNQIKNSLANEDFEDDKMDLLKVALRDKCLLTSQVREFMRMFTFEGDKLEFAKYAFHKTYDVDNYYLVSGDLEYSSDKEELNQYVLSNRY